MINNISIDLVTLLLFAMPGFFLILGFGVKQESDFKYLMLSMFWGILIVVVFSKIFPNQKFDSLLGNPYAGAVIFSASAYFVGLGGREITPSFKWLQTRFF